MPSLTFIRICCLLLTGVVLVSCEKLSRFKSGDSVIVSRKTETDAAVKDEKLIWLIARTEQDFDTALAKLQADETLGLIELVVLDKVRIIEGPEIAVFRKYSGKYVQLELNLEKAKSKDREQFTGYVLADQVDIRSSTP